MATIILPKRIKGDAKSPPLDRWNAKARAEEISAALVLQNYTGCMDMLSNSNLDEVEHARLSALIAINTGYYEQALAKLTIAVPKASPAKAAHLCYICGLIKSKRYYDIEASNAFHERGLKILRTAPVNADGDLELERAWLLNGLALNKAFSSRQASDSHTLTDEAFFY